MKKIYTLISLCLICGSSFAQPGALDKTFANSGRFLNTTPPANTFFGSVNKVIIQPDGKILLAGYGRDYSGSDGSDDFAVMRLNADGTIDNSFSNDGIAFVDFSVNGNYSSDYANDIFLQADNKIILAGVANQFSYDPSTDTYSYYDIAVARLNEDGSPDNSFNGNGKKTIDMAPLNRSATGFTKYNYDFANACIVNPDGRVDIAGQTNVYDANGFSNYDAFVMQLNSDGNFDNSFDLDGIKIMNAAGSDEIINSITVDAKKNLLLGGWTYSYITYNDDLLVERLNIDGSTDNDFGNGGIAIIDGDYTSENGYTLAIQADKKIVLSGLFNNNNLLGISLTRINENGSLDNSFSDDGVQTFYQPNENNSAGTGLVIQADGKILVTGYNLKNTSTSPYEGGNNYEVIRYNSDGTIDNSFGNYGRSIVDFGNWTDGVNDYCGSCALQNDGKLIAAGYTNGYIDNNNYSGGSVARILTDGIGVSISAPPDQNVQAADGECSVVINDIDPILDPSNSTATVNYELYGATKGAGTGSLSGTQFNIGTTAAIYSLADNPLNRAIFNVTVNGGNNSAGGALDFDGIDDRVNLGNIYSYTGQYSFEAWIKVRAYTNDDGLGAWIFGNERNVNNGIQVQLDTIGYITTFQPSLGFVKSTYKVPLDTWTHIAFVQSSSDLRLYVNGDYVETLLTAPNLHNTYLGYETFLLGAFSSDFVNYTRHFNGEMDEIKFWNKAICQAQIQNNLHCEISGYADGLIAYYKMNQGIAGCSNLETAYLNGEPGYGTLENFALSGGTSNWEQGYVTGSCAPFSPLSFICPGPITVDVDPGQCGAIVNFKADVIPGCSPNVTVSYSQEPGTYFGVGTTYVYVYASDDFGNNAYCDIPVTVVEHEPPVLVTKNISVPLDIYGNAYIYNAYDLIESVSDNCGIDPWAVNVIPNYFNCSNLGDNIVAVSAYDRSGNITLNYVTVTVTPFVTTSKLEVSPSPVQYSDLVSFKAIIPGGYMFSSCLNSPEVTFKLGDQVLGTVPLGPDYYGNYFDLTATLNKQILPSDLGTTSRKVTAVFGGTSNGSIVYDKEVYAKLVLKKEDAGIEYTASQFLTTPCSTCINASIPFTAFITDTADIYRGDIHNASATVTITPVTAGASVIGDNTITIPALTLVSNQNTIGLLKGKFNVSIGSNKKARFDVLIQAGNYYTGKLKVPVFVTRGNGAAISEFSSAPPDMKAITGKNFDVTAMPNPTHDQFTLKIQSSDLYQKINLRIMDVAGRVIETKQAINTNETVQLGHAYKAGTYMVEISQGQNHKLIRLVKL